MNRTEENLKRIRAFSRDNEGHMAFDDWDESKHPRRPDGKFGSGGGAPNAAPKAKTKPSKPAKRKWDDDVDSPEEFEQKLNKAEARIKEAEERRAYFNEEFKKTGRQLYRNMAASETEEINKIRNVLSEGYLKLDKMKKSRSAATKA